MGAIQLIGDLCAVTDRLVRQRSARVYRTRVEAVPQGHRWPTLAAAVLLSTTSCQLVQNFNAFSVDQDRVLGLQAFEQVLAEERRIDSGAAFEQVQRVTGRLVDSARQFDPEIVEAFEWQAELIDKDDAVNAFCLPGGKMAVYTGILPVAQSDAGLAVVMGHEIAHATYRHGTKAMSRGAFLQIALAGLAVYRGDSSSEMEQLATQLGPTLVVLKFGRNAELEADRAGLMYMARAGYDPREAVEFWSRMGGAGGGQAPPEFLSTHPSHGTRIERLQSLMPEALEEYRAATGARP